MAKTTWRFEFVDINKSIEINETESQWTGFAVIRAPKGSTEAMYIPPNNRSMIESMFGYASADWPDLFEVIDFNNEYGLYISAPTAEVSECPNYYGGVYITSLGLLPAYKLTNKKSPNFEVGLIPGSENSILGINKNSEFELLDINKPGTQALITIKNVDASVVRKVDYIDLTWGGRSFRYKLDKTNGFIRPSTFMTTEDAGLSKVCGTFELTETGDTYNFYLGGGAGTNPLSSSVTANAWNTENDWTSFNIPFLDFTHKSYKFNVKYNYNQYIPEGVDFEDWKGPEYFNDREEILNAILNGGEVPIGPNDSVTLEYKEPLKESIRLVYNCEEITKALNVQPSPTANKTTLYFKDFVYDKWSYEESLFFTKDLTNVLPGTANFNILANTDYKVLKVVETNVGKQLSVWQYNFDKYEEEYIDDWGVTQTREVTIGWEDISEEEETKVILAWEPLTKEDKDDSIKHNIYKVIEGALNQMTENSDVEDLRLVPNKLFNSFRAWSVEEDMEGELHTSGDFTGSLDEFGTDENGSDNYWEELLVPDESVCFAEIRVYDTFDKDLDAKGIYTGKRLNSETSYVVSGQRYTDFVVEQAHKAGITGGEITSAPESIQKRWAKVIKNGLIEAAKPKYGDVSLFFECSGLDLVKTYMGAIRTMHYTSTMIAPKLINETIFNNVNKMNVTGRYRGFAQYCQELLYKDRNLRKKYYSCPIGAVAVMLMRIMESYLGGVAPSWLNEGIVGGQLEGCMSRTPIAPRWDFEDLDTKIMDAKGINPIVMDADDGVMMVSQKTTELGAGDWSKLGHSMAFDLTKREIRDQVMKPQLSKKINDHWIEKRQTQVDKILAKRTSAGVYSYANCDIAKVNNEYTKAQNVFNIAVEVRATPYSEKVRLTFTNLAQTTSVSD